MLLDFSDITRTGFFELKSDSTHAVFFLYFINENMDSKNLRSVFGLDSKFNLSDEVLPLVVRREVKGLSELLLLRLFLTFLFLGKKIKVNKAQILSF